MNQMLRKILKIFKVSKYKFKELEARKAIIAAQKIIEKCNFSQEATDEDLKVKGDA